MHEEKQLVEAALYISGRPLTIHEIQNATGISSLKRVRELIKELELEYESRAGALEVVRLPRQRFVLQLNPSLSERVAELAPHGLLSLGELKTLVYIALSQPILQSSVVVYRGSHSYQHIKILEEHGFVQSIPQGRTKELTTTQMFADYFGFDYEVEKLKGQLRRMIQKIRLEQKELASSTEI
ncbi:MAG: SMC-Scp complex subunit ScpB [Promethearchaeota archaeon]